MDDAALLERNLRGLAALYRLIGHYAGSVFELEGAVGSLARMAPDYPWLNAFVCEPGANFERVLEHLAETPELDRLGVWACGPQQVGAAAEAGVSRLIARVPAMSMELSSAKESEGGSEPIALAEAGELSDTAYGNSGRELERTLARFPPELAQARGRRDTAGRVVAAAVLLESEDDCSVQYVATRPDAQRLGHGAALLGHTLAQVRRRGCSTTSLQSSDAGVRLYRRLGYRAVGQLELRHRARRPPEAGSE
jgi:ribosomal protein S18 acetylase RimI-like enzyme